MGGWFRHPNIFIKILETPAPGPLRGHRYRKPGYRYPDIWLDLGLYGEVFAIIFLYYKKRKVLKLQGFLLPAPMSGSPRTQNALGQNGHRN